MDSKTEGRRAVNSGRRKTNLWQRALTKPVWWWQRNRPYPIRNKVWRLPPLPFASDAEVTLLVLTTPSNLNNAAWSAYSFGLQLANQVTLRITVDGDFDSKARSRLRKLFPNVELSSTAEDVKALKDECPEIAALAAKHAMGRKIAAVTRRQREGRVLFIDDDVLALGPLSDLQARLTGDSVLVSYIREGNGHMMRDPGMIAAAERLGLRWIEDINVGLLLIPRLAFNLPLLNQVLSEAEEAHSWFPDTVLFSLLLARHPHKALPNRYVVNTQGQFCFEPPCPVDQLAVRHYVGPVRHLMYREGMPWVLRKIQSQSVSVHET